MICRVLCIITQTRQKTRPSLILEPDSVELESISYLNDNFDNVVLVVNSNAALELDWVNDYANIKSIVLAPSGLSSLPEILSGEVNPSGRTVDTFAADALASPLHRTLVITSIMMKMAMQPNITMLVMKKVSMSVTVTMRHAMRMLY